MNTTTRSSPGRFGRESRPAFTIVELLVVIAIIGLLVALLLPAIQAARESARKMSCSNNLRQVGLAVPMFEESRRSLPMSAYGRPYAKFPDNPQSLISSVFTHLLPYLEEKAAYESYDWNRDWAVSENQNAVNTVVPTFRCPSSSSEPLQRGLRAGGIPYPNHTAAVSDFTAVYSWGYPRRGRPVAVRVAQGWPAAGNGDSGAGEIGRPELANHPSGSGCNRHRAPKEGVWRWMGVGHSRTWPTQSPRKPSSPNLSK